MKCKLHPIARKFFERSREVMCAADRGESLTKFNNLPSITFSSYSEMFYFSMVLDKYLLLNGTSEEKLFNQLRILYYRRKCQAMNEPLTDDEGEVRELTIDDFRRMRRFNKEVIDALEACDENEAAKEEKKKIPTQTAQPITASEIKDMINYNLSEEEKHDLLFEILFDCE